MKKEVIKNSRFFFIMATIVLMALLLGIGCTGFGAYADANRTVETIVGHISDAHIFPTEFSNLYLDLDIGSTKLTAQSESALQTALDEIYKMEDAPKIILVSGDLTNNGEYEANLKASKAFAQLTEKIRSREGYENFQIFVMPGNHDMYNDGASSNVPTKEELDQCESDEERVQLMKNYKSRSVRTTTSKDIFEIYSDFGFCNCEGRKNGVHTHPCKMAQGTKVNYFYESEYWFDDDTKRVNTADGVVYEGFDTRPATEKEMKKYEENGLNFEYLAEAGRIGICSYVATLNGVTVISVDGNAREYTGDYSTVATNSACGWDETTGGMVTEAQLRWIVDETKEEVANDNLMMVNCHYNNIAHFESQDEVISLFVLDNLEQFTSTLSNAGIRYAFTGHQHAFDITNTISQKGSIMYDIESGSTVSYGSGFRTVNFKQKWENGNYSEEVKSTVHSLDNNTSDGFAFGIYKLTSELTAEDEILTQNVVNPEIFTAEPENLYEGTDYFTYVKMYIEDKDGNKLSIGDFLAQGLANLISFDGMVGGIVNDGLYDTLAGATDGLANYSFLHALLGDIIEDLPELDLLAFVDKGNGKFELSEKAEKDNDLIGYATDLITYLLEYDFSYGKNPTETTLSDILVTVYGGHLSGAHGDSISNTIKPLIENLNNGNFVNFLLTTLVDGLVPQLELIFNAPIRFNEETAELSEGVGFDITNALKISSNGVIDNVSKSILKDFCFKTTDKKGYTSLKNIVSDLSVVAKDLLVTPMNEIENSQIKTLATLLRGVVSKYFKDIGDLVNTVLGYINKYLDCGSLYDVLQTELMDKYVTDAFCRNLGDYASYILTGMDADDTPDGSYWGTGDKMKAYTVKNKANFNITSTKSNASEVFKGYAFYRAKGTEGKLKVVATEENGLLPSMISVSFNEDMGTEKKIKWVTSFEQNVFDKNGSKYEHSVPESFIKYSLNSDMNDAVTVKANSKNVDKELPTIDLGIMYFNMSHRYKFYNQHEVSLTNLEKGKTYYYQLGSGNYWSETYSFTTASEGGFRFMAMTDIQGSVKKNYIDSLPSLEIAMEQFGEDKPAFIASMGDNVDNGKNILQYTWWLDEQQKIWANNTLVTSGGNHEDEDYALSNTIALPDNANIKETGHYYSYDYNNAHFIVLDTNDITDNQLSANQVKWLTDDLEKDKNNTNTNWVIVMLHKGPYTAGSHAFDSDVIGLRAQLTPIFAENGVDLVLQGHDHTYSVSEYIGAEGNPIAVDNLAKVKDTDDKVLYINLGTMGDKFYDYIYSEEVSLINRNSVDERLNSFYNEEKGLLELKETPVFADIFIDENNLKITTYTIVDGEAVKVDEIGMVKELSGNIWETIKENPNAIISFVAVAVGVLVVVVLCLLAVANRKKKAQWNK